MGDQERIRRAASRRAADRDAEAAEIAANSEWFYKTQLKALLTTHPKKYALIRHCTIVAFFDASKDACEAGYLGFEDGLFSVQEVAEYKMDLFGPGRPGVRLYELIYDCDGERTRLLVQAGSDKHAKRIATNKSFQDRYVLAEEYKTCTVVSTAFVGIYYSTQNTLRAQTPPFTFLCIGAGMSIVIHADEDGKMQGGFDHGIPEISIQLSAGHD